MDVKTIARAIADTGLIVRGGFRVGAEDNVPGAPQAVVLVGNAGPEMWKAFTAQVSPVERRRSPHPLDLWIRVVLQEAAARLRAQVLFPFAGPPFLPFLRWARRAESVYPSPVGPLIHPEFGLHHAYRGAFAFAAKVDLEDRPSVPNPCSSCSDQPCLQACPVAAIRCDAYDVAACVDHLGSDVNGECMTAGCRARRACPVGQSYHYQPEQAVFHMEKFRAAQAPRYLGTG